MGVLELNNRDVPLQPINFMFCDVYEIRTQSNVADTGVVNYQWWRRSGYARHIQHHFLLRGPRGGQRAGMEHNH